MFRRKSTQINRGDVVLVMFSSPMFVGIWLESRFSHTLIHRWLNMIMLLCLSSHSVPVVRLFLCCWVLYYYGLVLFFSFGWFVLNVVSAHFNRPLSSLHYKYSAFRRSSSLLILIDNLAFLKSFAAQPVALITSVIPLGFRSDATKCNEGHRCLGWCHGLTHEEEQADIFRHCVLWECPSASHFPLRFRASAFGELVCRKTVQSSFAHPYLVYLAKYIGWLTQPVILLSSGSVRDAAVAPPFIRMTSQMATQWSLNWLEARNIQWRMLVHDHLIDDCVECNVEQALDRKVSYLQGIWRCPKNICEKTEASTKKKAA